MDLSIDQYIDQLDIINIQRVNSNFTHSLLQTSISLNHTLTTKFSIC